MLLVKKFKVTEMEMIVNLKEHSYPIYIEKNILKHANEKIKEVFKGKKIMIISDDQVYPLYGDDLTLNLEKDFKVNHVVVPHGEKSKRFDMLPTLYKACLDFKLTRTDLIIALGGGVIGDMAGFVASSYLRGVKLVQIPTSLLAQVDSSVGGKVAVDLPEGKNLVGAFYHPSMVLIDPCTLKTLDPHFISDGMGEVIKYGCIKDKKLFDQLNSYQNFEELYEFIDEIIYNCVNIKREVVEKDQFDFGDRLLLNFGHTYAHAIEQYYHYEKYSHGEAVGIGMYQITKLAESLDLTKTGSSMQIKEILQKYNLPYECQVETKNLIQAISLDKKNIMNEFKRIKCNFETVAKNFKLIEQDTRTIFINIESEAENLLQEIKSKGISKERMRRAGQYCIQVFGNESGKNSLFNHLYGAGMIRPVSGEMKDFYELVSLEQYSECCGLVMTIDDEMALFF